MVGLPESPCLVTHILSPRYIVEIAIYYSIQSSICKIENHNTCLASKHKLQSCNQLTLATDFTVTGHQKLLAHCTLLYLHNKLNRN